MGNVAIAGWAGVADTFDGHSVGPGSFVAKLDRISHQMVWAQSVDAGVQDLGDQINGMAFTSSGDVVLGGRFFWGLALALGLIVNVFPIPSNTLAPDRLHRRNIYKSIASLLKSKRQINVCAPVSVLALRVAVLCQHASPCCEHATLNMDPLQRIGEAKL
jgi:hypothetical protein